ncbi:MAG: hypothetical protein LBN97_01925 [Oscillospiraceae bacterium]|nr:hypothetical protein [Oscillospiraceae bacterium]
MHNFGACKLGLRRESVIADTRDDSAGLQAVDIRTSRLGDFFVVRELDGAARLRDLFDAKGFSDFDYGGFAGNDFALYPFAGVAEYAPDDSVNLGIADGLRRSEETFANAEEYCVLSERPRTDSVVSPVRFRNVGVGNVRSGCVRSERSRYQREN